MADQDMKVGDSIIFTDRFGKDANALIVTAWGKGNAALNLVHVSLDESKTDNAGYGRQIERQSSVVHKSSQGAHGNYWRRLDEEPNPFTPPTSV